MPIGQKHLKFLIIVMAATGLMMGLCTSPARAATVVPVGTDGVVPDDPCYNVYYDCGVSYQASGVYGGSAGMYDYSPDFAQGHCRTRWAERKQDNLFGGNQWTYFEQVRWCWNGTVVTRFWRDRWVGNTGWGWTFDDNIYSNCMTEHCYPGRTGHFSEMANTEGHFHVCLGALGINYCRNKYPWITIRVYADGSSDVSTSS